MAESSKKMGLVGLTTLVAVNMMGSGIIMLPSNMAQLGAVSLLSWIVTAIGSMAIAYCFAQCGLLCNRSGGMSAYSEEAHGKSAFFLCSFLYFLSLAIGNVAIGISAVGYMIVVHPLAGQWRHSAVHRHDRPAVVDHSWPTSAARASPARSARSPSGA